jgi:CHAT domain-containing protein
VVHACPAATAPDAVAILRQAARGAGAGGDPDSAQVLERYAVILDHCRLVGPDETFAAAASAKLGPADIAWDKAEEAWQAYQHAPGTRRIRQAERRWRRLLSVLPPPVPGYWPEAGMHAMLYLAEILIAKHQEHADRGAVDEAVGWLRNAAEREPPPGLHAEIQGGLGAALAVRYEGWGEAADLDDAITALSAADIGEAPRQVHANALSALCGALLSRYEERGTPADLAASVDAGERAISRAEPGTREWYDGSNNLALALHDRYEHGGDLADLARSAGLLERAAGHLPGAAAGGNPEAFGNLGIARLSWYEATGEDAALDAAISAITAALAGAGLDAPGRPAILNTFGACLTARHDRTGALDDLHAAEAAFTEAAGTALPGARERAIYLDNLSGALRSRYARHGDASALSGAVDVAREAVALTGADAPERSRRMLSLAHALGARYEARGAEDDRDASLDSYREAVALSQETAPDHWLYLAGLGTGLLDRLSRVKEPADADEAVAVHQDAIRTAPPGAAEMPGLHLHYAQALRIRREAGNAADDLAAAREEYKRAGELGLRLRPEVALAAYRELGDWAVEQADWPEAGQAYWSGVAAMHLLVGSQTTRTDREAWLRTARGMPARAAATLAAAGLAEKAAVAYERGRAILLTEALDRQQADLDAVRAAGRPDLADQYLAAASRVTALGQRELSEAAARPAGLSDQRAAARRRARGELEQATTAIREEVMPGFRRPVEIAELVQAAGNVPVVHVVAGPVQGTALIIRDGVRPVPLPLLTEARLAARARDFVTAREGRRHDPQAWDMCLDTTTRWLWDAVLGPIIGLLEPSGRAVLIPAGELGILPLHAAWTIDPATGSRVYALDRLLVTYAPNARTLAASQRHAAVRDAAPLLVIDDAGAGLRAVSTEAALVRRGFARGAAPAGAPVPGTGEPAEVIAALHAHGTAHFACHGVANLTEPLDSALLLPGGRLTLRDLLAHGALPLRLAILSACETAVPGADLPDEVIGLPAGFLEVGAAGAIGSLWAVPDASTMLVMARFYEIWRAPATAMPAAEALRQAQIWVRDASNGVKHARFPESTPPHLRDVPQARRAFWEAANSHAHPRSWAAFAFYGA